MRIVCYLVMNQQNQPFQDLTVDICNGSNNKDISLLYSTYHKKPDRSILDESGYKKCFSWFIKHKSNVAVELHGIANLRYNDTQLLFVS